MLHETFHAAKLEFDLTRPLRFLPFLGIEIHPKTTASSSIVAINAGMFHFAHVRA